MTDKIRRDSILSRRDMGVKRLRDREYSEELENSLPYNDTFIYLKVKLLMVN